MAKRVHGSLRIDHPRAAVSGDVSGLFSLEDSVANQRVTDAICKAGRSGRRERL